MVWTVAIIIATYAIAGAFSHTLLGSQLSFAIGLERDRSMSEILTYGFSFSAALLFLLAAIEHRSRALLFLAVLMLFIWFDDSANYHEKFGRWISYAVALPVLPNSKEQGTGEIIAWIIASVPLGLGLLYVLRARDYGDLGVLGLVSGFFATLIVCGVFVDALHMMMGSTLRTFFIVVEDGGEMVALAGIAGVAIGLTRTGGTYFERQGGGN